MLFQNMKQLIEYERMRKIFYFGNVNFLIIFLPTSNFDKKVFHLESI